jgi:hypothetical protein
MPDRELVFPVSAEWKREKAWVDEDGYRRAYERSQGQTR